MAKPGCKPSNAKVKAITEMPKPTTLKDLQTFLGMVQYLSKFSPRIAEIAEPLTLSMLHVTIVVLSRLVQKVPSLELLPATKFSVRLV